MIKPKETLISSFEKRVLNKKIEKTSFSTLAFLKKVIYNINNEGRKI